MRFGLPEGWHLARRVILALVLLLMTAVPAFAVGAIEVGILRFRVPDAWVQMPAAGQRAAAFEVPTERGTAIATFDRIMETEATAVMASWPGLFGEAPDTVLQRRWVEKIAGCPVHLARLEGTWQGEEVVGSGMATMVAVLFESRRGLVLVRLIGRPEAVEEATPSFLAVIKKAQDGWKS